MKRLIWLGILLLSASWMFFLPVFYPADLVIGFLFLVIGIICVSLGLYKAESVNIDTRYLLFLIPLLLSIVLVEFPYNLGLIVIAVSLAGFCITGVLLDYVKHTWIWKGVFLGGLVLVVQAAVMSFLAIFSSIYHRVDFLSHFVRLGVSIFGIKTTLNGGRP